MISYRCYRNTDPPGLYQVWNEALTGRGSVILPSPSAFEEFVFAKPYFEAAGLLVAQDDGTTVGFAHSGFGPNAEETALVTDAGVLCLLAVRPSHQRRGIGTELLTRSEAYLRGRGATTLFAGPLRPLNPFYLGLYGGSESPGFLTSDTAAEPFLTHRGYTIQETCLVFHRSLETPLGVVDARFTNIRRRYDLVAAPRTGVATWWQECVLGPLELLDVRLVEKGGGAEVARASVWEMVGHSHRLQAPTVGIIDLEVREDLRRQGLAKFVIAALLRHMQEQFFALVEVQTMEQNAAAVALYQGLGFERVDRGHVYRKT